MTKKKKPVEHRRRLHAILQTIKNSRITEARDPENGKYFELDMLIDKYFAGENTAEEYERLKTLIALNTDNYEYFLASLLIRDAIKADIALNEKLDTLMKDVDGVSLGTKKPSDEDEYLRFLSRFRRKK